MSLSRFTRGLISSHISARSAPLWDQIEVAMMEPETEKKRKRARPGSTKTTSTIPDTAVTALPSDNRLKKGRADASQPAGRPTRAERRSSLRQARASHVTAATDEPGPGSATFETERSVCDTAGRNNRVYADTLRGVRTSLLPPNTASASTSSNRSPANRSAPSPRETKIDLLKPFANLAGMPPSSAVDAGPPEFDTSRGRAPESDMPWPDRAPRRERQLQRTAQAERPAVKVASAQRNRRRSQVENTSVARGQWSVARDPNVSRHPFLSCSISSIYYIFLADSRRCDVCARPEGAQPGASARRALGAAGVRVTLHSGVFWEHAVRFPVLGLHPPADCCCRYGVSHAHSDLDMVIIVRFIPCILHPHLFYFSRTQSGHKVIERK